MKSYKFSFSKETYFSIAALLLYVFEVILLLFLKFSFSSRVLASRLIYYLVSAVSILFLVTCFMILSKPKTKWFLFVSTFCQLGLCAYDIVSSYKTLPFATFGYRFLMIITYRIFAIICIISYAILSMWVLGIIKNRIIATSVVSCILICDIICFVQRIFYNVEYVNRFPIVVAYEILMFTWCIPFNIAILFSCLPLSKKQKYRMKVESVEQALQTLKMKFENNDITEEEYELRKNEYLNSL